MRPGEEETVCALVHRSFARFVAPDLPPEGVQEFLAYADAEALARRVLEGAAVLVAVHGDRMAGMIELRGSDHIALLFVDASFHGRGLARALFEQALVVAREHRPPPAHLTVNASRYAVPVYEKLGFRQTGPEQVVNGLRFIPMRLGLAAAAPSQP